jgi:hypothetical protein
MQLSTAIRRQNHAYESAKIVAWVESFGKRNRLNL